MAAEDRSAPDHLDFLRQASAEARLYGFFPLVRRAEARAAAQGLPRVGHARRPARNVVDLAHSPQLAFPGATVDQIAITATGRAQIRSCFLGLTGPMGALPLHLTEFAVFEQRYARRQPFGQFLDLLTDRMLQFFYRAWADSQPACEADRPGEDRFAGYLSALTGAGIGASEDGPLPARERLRHAGLFISRRGPGALRDGISAMIGARAEIIEYVGGWRTIEPEERTRLGGMEGFGRANRLGTDAMLGQRVLLCDDSFAVAVACRDLDHFRGLLPDGAGHARAVAAVEMLKPSHLEWELRLGIDEREAPSAKLDGGSRLGWTSWLTPLGRDVVRTDLRLRPRPGVAGAH